MKKQCTECGAEKQGRVECWNCGGEGVTHHDCGEDCCCCLDPVDNVRCDICCGRGSFKVCEHCYQGDGELMS